MEYTVRVSMPVTYLGRTNHLIMYLAAGTVITPQMADELLEMYGQQLKVA